MNTHVVIMAGGIGSRLWPVSTPEKPKQFIDLLGIGRTLIQMTVERFRPVCNMENFWVVTSEKYVPTVREQLPQIPAAHILAEPCARNTAPCIAYACWKIARECPDANVVVTPADALVINVEKFAGMVRKALNFTEESSSIVTIGVKPTRPETGYGYICADETASDKKEDTGSGLEEILKVKEFKEKPSLEKAREYLAAGNYFWNAGIFVWNVRTIVSQLKEHAPQIAAVMDSMALSFGNEDEQQKVRELFPSCEKISIDYAVMEKSRDIYVISGDLGWSDLGSFSSIKEHIPDPSDDPVPELLTCSSDRESEDGGNKAIGADVRLIDSEGCMVHAEGSKMVVVKGLKDYIVALKDGNLLVCPLSDEQSIKEYSKPKES